MDNATNKNNKFILSNIFIDGVETRDRNVIRIQKMYTLSVHDLKLYFLILKTIESNNYANSINIDLGDYISLYYGKTRNISTKIQTIKNSLGNLGSASIDIINGGILHTYKLIDSAIRIEDSKYIITLKSELIEIFLQVDNKYTVIDLDDIKKISNVTALRLFLVYKRFINYKKYINYLIPRAREVFDFSEGYRASDMVSSLVKASQELAGLDFINHYIKIDVEKVDEPKKEPSKNQNHGKTSRINKIEIQLINKTTGKIEISDDDIIKEHFDALFKGFSKIDKKTANEMLKNNNLKESLSMISLIYKMWQKNKKRNPLDILKQKIKK